LSSTVSERTTPNYKQQAKRTARTSFALALVPLGYNNKHTTREPRVSKFEKYIQVRIKEEFPDLEVQYSNKTALVDAGEVDVFVPAFKLAFEIQGISHFQPIYRGRKIESRAG
jgi:hypothetical protein